jgi:hypothetical protein
MVLATTDQNRALTDYFKPVAVNADGSSFVNFDAQQIGMGGHHRVQIRLPMTNHHVLVDGSVLQQTEANFMARNHHDAVVSVRILRIARCATHQAKK